MQLYELEESPCFKDYIFLVGWKNNHRNHKTKAVFICNRFYYHLTQQYLDNSPIQLLFPYNALIRGFAYTSFILQCT